MCVGVGGVYPASTFTHIICLRFLPFVYNKLILGLKHVDFVDYTTRVNIVITMNTFHSDLIGYIYGENEQIYLT